jgi:hypothetical protein
MKLVFWALNITVLEKNGIEQETDKYNSKNYYRDKYQKTNNTFNDKERSFKHRVRRFV